MSSSTGGRRERADPKRGPRSEEPLREAWRLLFELGRGMKSRLQSTFQEKGLSFQQGMLLHHLAEGGPQQMNEFANLLDCDASNVTGLVDRLEARGLLTRQPSEEDRRVKLLVLTNAGTKLRSTMLEELLEPPEALKKLPAAEQKELRDLLEKTLTLLGPAEEP
jgi:MarR family transcriptional regulator, organic hydroperoxide resistance regulator